MINTPAAWAKDVLRLLHTLQPHVVTVVSLRYFALMTEDQICAHTGWSERRVRRATAEGLRELGRLVEESRGPVRS